MSLNAMNSLELALARKRVRDHADDVLGGSQELEECVETDCRVQRAVDAFRWIVRAEEALRQSAYEGLIDFTPQLETSLESLYREWLVSCEVTERALARHPEHACCAANASEFREVAAEAREKINASAWVRKSRKLRNVVAPEASES